MQLSNCEYWKSLIDGEYVYTNDITIDEKPVVNQNDVLD